MNRQDFPIVPTGRFAAALPLLVGGVFVLGAIVAIVVAPAAPRVLLAALAPLFVVVPLAGLVAWALRHPRVSLDDGVLQAGRLPRVRVPVRDFELDAARLVDLDAPAERPLTPLFRLFGTRLPGYRAGWFWLRNRAHAFLVVTDPRRVLLLPRRDGGPLMLSVERPDALLAALRRARG
jgi:hypothetical protein